MRQAWCAMGLCVLAGCSWFGKSQCSEGTQRCEGNAIATCAANVSSSTTTGNAPVYAWRKTSSCSVEDRGLVCHEEDGFAACVAASLIDGGVPSAGHGGDAAVAASMLPIFSDALRSAPAAWTRVDVAASANGVAHIAQTSSALLAYAPATPTQGQVAAVSYDVDDHPVSAALVSLRGAGSASAWVRSDSATKIRLVAPDGGVVDTVSLAAVATPKSAASTTSAAGLTRITSALSTDLPATMNITPPGQVLPPLSLWGGEDTLISVPATPEMVGFVADALQRLPPFAASILTGVAFTDNAVHAIELGTFDHISDGGATEIALASGEDDAGVSGGLLTADAAIARPPSWLPMATHAAVNQQAMLYIDASPSALEDYRRQPAELAVEIIRQVASVFVSMTTRPLVEEVVGQHFAFPQDYPADIQALLEERVSPLLMPGESFTDVWAGLHNIGVQGQLAEPYNAALTLPDAVALQGGFATGVGVQGPAEDFAEYAAYASVPELWNASPCPTLQVATLDTLDPKMFVHAAKLEVLWGLGLLSGARLQSCFGDLITQPNPAGIVVHDATGARDVFDQAVYGAQEPLYHGQTQVALTANQGAAGQELSASFAVSATGLTTGLFRLTSVGHRPNPEVGAGFYFEKPKTYQRMEASAGLMLVTHADDQQIEGHALLVQQGLPLFATPLAGTPVLPAITAHYEFPNDDSK
ncbi:MAG: hypothetical protein JWN04_2594 [Myxococcaceae bacterium]|nr:hypothetical protein [Myxococcaceae bacterium]